MKKLNMLFVVLLILAAADNVLAESKALTYHDCILEATRDGFFATRRDLGRVKELCEERFPGSVPNILGDKLDDEALAKIDIYTNMTKDGDINGSVYNGLPHIIVTRLDVLLTPKTQKDAVMDFFDSEEYQLNLKIKPYSTEQFSIESEKTKIDGRFSWKLIRAWGY